MAAPEEVAVQRTGVIADDFTGATDIASAYVARGHRSVVATTAAAAATVPAEVDAVVVALKTRTAPVTEAVEDSLAALTSLRSAGCERFVFKYCSTFDSTPAGNIGPVLDALSDALGATSVPVVPSFPDNGRTVYQGHLFVGADLLEHSSMRHHPLTPMTESRVADILRPQTRSSVGELHLHEVRGPQALGEAMRTLGARYVVLDAIDDHDLRRIAADLEAAPLLSGAAGLALGVPPGNAEPTGVVGVTDGRRLVVCGSASRRTREQIRSAADAGAPMRRLDVRRATEDADGLVAETLAWLGTLPADGPAPVVYTVGDLSDLADRAAAGAIEQLLTAVVLGAVARRDVRAVVVAGGETSGAVVAGLGGDALDIGPAIAPGVCWSGMTTSDGDRIALALKSGNFGDVDMFTTAWEALA